MITLIEKYKELCTAQKVKPDIGSFKSCESIMKKNALDLIEQSMKSNKAVVISKRIDDTFTYVVILEQGNARPEILQEQELQSRLSYARRNTDDTQSVDNI